MSPATILPKGPLNASISRRTRKRRDSSADRPVGFSRLGAIRSQSMANTKVALVGHHLYRVGLPTLARLATSSNQGTHIFPGGVTLFTAGGQTLTAQDTANSSLTGCAVVAVVAAPASQLLITAPATAVTGTPFDVTLTALDPYSNVDMNYGGTVTWTSSDTDPGLLLPADYTFQPTDNGMVTFSGGVTLITLGNQSITATDTVSGITGTATVAVGSGLPPD